VKIQFRKFQHLNQAEALALLDIRNQSFVRENMYDTSVISAESHLSWISRLQTRDDCVYWAIVLNGVIVGCIDITSIDTAASFAEWGFYLDRKYFGFGAVVEFLGLTHFMDMGICTIKACVKESNAQVLRMHTDTFGFKLCPEFSTRIGDADYIGAVLSKDDWLVVSKALSEKMALLLKKSEVDWE